MGFKLNWFVAREDSGKFLRRRLLGDMFNVDYIDVEWTHSDGFPPDTIEVPLTHPPDIKYETRIVGQRTVIKDQVTVAPTVPDSTVAMMLDEKRHRLAKSLNIDP